MKYVQSRWLNHAKLLKSIRNTKKRFLFLITAPILVLASAGIVHAITTSNAHNRGVIAFIGDSNITLAVSTIDLAMTWGNHNDNSYTPVFISRVGTTIRTPDCLNVTGCTTYNYWQTKLGETLPKVNADAFVVDLGINDTVGPGTATTQGYSYYGQKIDWFMNLLPTNKPVFWTNLPCAIEPTARLTGCHAVNYALGQAPKRWPNFKLVNWGAIAYTHPEYIDDSSTGGVHYNIYGYNAWTSLVVSTLDAQFPIPNN